MVGKSGNVKDVARRSFVKALKLNVKVEELLDHFKVRNLKRSGKYINGSCPLPTHGGPDEQPSFGMQDDQGSKWNGFYKCWKCGKGSVVDFVMVMQGGNFNSAVAFLKAFSSGGDLFSEGALDREMGELNEEPGKERDEDWDCYIPPMWKDPMFIAYYMTGNKKRKFNAKGIAELIEEYEIGLADYKGKVHIIIPLKDEQGTWRAFFAQNPFKNSEKWFPKGSKIGNLLFGLDSFIGKTNEITIAEGVWDALKIIQFGHPCVATFSTSITERQAEFLAEYFQTVNIAYDSDDGGDIGVERATDLLYPEVDLFRLNFPDETDPCLLSSAEYVCAYSARTSIVKY